MTLIILRSDSQNPYYNLAIEELAFNRMKTLSNSLLLYIWINEPSVIIGRNQNPYTECDLVKMKMNEIYLVRRKTGGGAVFQDLGNLNYTIIGREAFAEKEKWNQVISNAIGKFGLNCRRSGRNDFQVDGYKVSGSAYMHDGDTYLQHGTMMINVCIDSLKTYLTPQNSKLMKYGIKSVEQRVCNLSELNSEINMHSIEKSIKESMIELYDDFVVTHAEINEFITDDINSLAEEYSADAFLYGDFSLKEQYSDDSL